MKTLLFLMLVVGSALVHAEDLAGSNPTGAERVCTLSSGAQTELGFADAIKQCKRGDILDMSWLSNQQAMQVCDFTKAVVYHPTKGTLIACVYTGARRPVIKPGLQ
ncbi:hypothetical protein [Parachitinimonas caeni]|uniref:Uncharacterized protein n=1 Tax=Parachitinimonas caeni TaxID=3031301 RepID=A0ABT7E3N8_9NEIS|nr:hypothetical protein [Parachitinimonas caeni]MDK2126913.1 hypothetical protein [Parachitinimonas caeni]